MNARLQKQWVILDVGCGEGSRSAPTFLSEAISVDISHASLKHLAEVEPGRRVVCAPLDRLPFGRSSVDVIVALDVLEHFSEEEALALLSKWEETAHKAVVIMTPNGFIEQKGTKDNPFMEHKSGWTANRFRALGYEVYGANGWRPLRGEGALPQWGVLGLYLSLLSQPLVRKRPEAAFHLIAYKELRRS